MAIEREIFDQASPNPDADQAIGLVQNAPGVPFQCGTCEHFLSGTCHNPLPKLNGQHVEPEWCCNHYEHDGMKTVIE
jgi:hypothetical protein